MNDATIYIKRIGFDFQRAFGFRQKATEKEKKNGTGASKPCNAM